MKISSGQGSPPVDRAKAWSYLVTNLLVLPGLGSVMGRRKIGYVQMLLAIGGFLLTLVALVRIVVLWGRDLQLPNEPGLYRSAIAGMAVFLVGWFWSLVTSLSFFRGG